MKITEATALIRTPLIEWARLQSWCDLGSGSGTFTMALAQLLAPGSTIYALDLDPRALERIPGQRNGVEIRKIVTDLQSSSLHLPSADGVLMANTLHFIEEQQVFLRRLLSVADRFLIVEYERTKSNPWGPYRVGFENSAKFSPRQESSAWRNWRHGPHCSVARCTRPSPNDQDHNPENF